MCAVCSLWKIISRSVAGQFCSAAQEPRSSHLVTSPCYIQTDYAIFTNRALLFYKLEETSLWSVQLIKDHSTLTSEFKLENIFHYYHLNY